VLPKNVWQYVAQIPRLAALGKRYVLQGGTQYNLAAVKAQVDYIKERVPDAEVLRAPAHGRGRRDRRGLRDVARGQAPRALDASSASTRRSGSRYTTKNDESRRVPLLSERVQAHLHRHEAARPARRSRYIAGFSCEKGTVESEEAMLALVEDRKKIARQFPNLVDYEAKLAFRHFYAAGAAARGGHAHEGRDRQARLPRHQARRDHAALLRAAPKECGASCAVARASACRACSTCTRRRRTSATYFEALGIPEAERRLQ
jgi:hypothetical protein